MQAKMVIVNKMPKILKIFPILVSGLIFSHCSSIYVPVPYEDDYVDLDKTEIVSLDENIIREIKKFYGAPYKWGGSSPKGTDCSGMIMTIYKNAANIALPHNADMMFKTTQKINSRDLFFGDLIFFSSARTNKATHMGMYIKGGYFVHASSSRGVILSKLNDKPYKKQFIGARRVK